MPEMMDIYRGCSAEYDELVSHEDYTGNLSSFLLDNFPWDGASVCEAGIGTGRVSKIYLHRAASLTGFDREEHMLNAARTNLSDWHKKIDLKSGENTALPLPSDKSKDIFIQGWSFGHTMHEHFDEIEKIWKKMFTAISMSLKSGGSIVMIESLSTNTSEPAPPTPALEKFFSLLTGEYGFSREILTTDYKFESPEEAARICGFFFGNEMGEAIRKNRSRVVPEYTGVFYRRI